MFDMYAVIKTGGKQYRVAKDDVIVVERLTGSAGDKIELDQVLMLDDGKEPTLGTPLVDGACVAATVVDQNRGDKIIVFKKKRRKNYRRTLGHRQELTVLRITDILAKGKKAKTTRAKAKDDAPAAEVAEAVAEDAATAAADAPAAVAPAADAPATDVAAKPKRASRAKKPAADAPVTEETAKPKRTPRAKKAAADTDAKAAAAEDAPKPKRKRAATPKAAKDDSGDAGEPEEKS